MYDKRSFVTAIHKIYIAQHDYSGRTVVYLHLVLLLFQENPHGLMKMKFSNFDFVNYSSSKGACTNYVTLGRRLCGQRF